MGLVQFLIIPNGKYFYFIYEEEQAKVDDYLILRQGCNDWNEYLTLVQVWF